MTLELLKQMARALSVQFGSDCEVVIHDLTRKSLGKSVVYIENGQVTNRKLGDGPSQVVLETLKKNPAHISDHLGYLTKTDDGRTLKSSTIFVRDEDGTIQYIFGINFDITKMLYLQDSIRPLIMDNATLTSTSGDSKPRKISSNVNDLLDDLIVQSVDMIGKPVSLMSKEEKKEAIRFLNETGAFLITKSGDKVSQYFGISKYTLYSYIKTTSTKEEDVS